MSTYPIGACQSCGARKVTGASACWQCGVRFTALPRTPAAPQRWTKAPWAGVVPLGLFFLPWVIAGRYGVHRVISIAGLELALGQSLRGRPVPYEPLLWLIPVASLLLVALLVRTYRRTPGPGHWLLIAITAWAGFLLLLIKAVQWLWVGPSPAPETIWVVHWLTTWFLLTSSAFLMSALAATRSWMDARGPRPLSSSSSPSSPSEDTPFDEEQIR
ncbi:membrane protein [Candidatus Methylomirabilis lanthanidiphila]|uniref:Membrane protein n=1 Tax=Candidatus Methylomirabilis lanthanidiphila TaxID=2211376 RepID=A0A564ZJH4_9BACT|nr:hypothetical protein [Candidatus Methylomirabilis lanthanidiphila]VUZ84792.1 membrane protein [Candidatus Methylomirabilis lanthanidiphila]